MKFDFSGVQTSQVEAVGDFHKRATRTCNYYEERTQRLVEGELKLLPKGNVRYGEDTL